MTEDNKGEIVGEEGETGINGGKAGRIAGKGNGNEESRRGVLDIATA